MLRESNHAGKLKKEDFQAMAAHAIAHLPEEACGLIAGEKSDTERVIKKYITLQILTIQTNISL